jgi:hypothetical protein
MRVPLGGVAAAAALAAVLLAVPGGAAAVAPPSRLPWDAIADAPAAAVQGVLASGTQRLVLSHGVALLHDGAEGLDGGVARLRLLLSDAPLDTALLEGVLPDLRLQELARGGALRAVLVSFDPANPEQVEITPLLAPAAGDGASMTSLALTRTGGPGPGAFESFSFLAPRLRASFSYSLEPSSGAAPQDIHSLSFRVNLQVQAEPAVTARVQGGDAVRATPQGRLALDRARTMAALDAAGLARLRVQDPASVPSLPAEIPESELLQMLRGLAADQLRGLGGQGLLLVERGDRAVLVIGEGEGLRSWITFRRRNGRWQFD